MEMYTLSKIYINDEIVGIDVCICNTRYIYSLREKPAIVGARGDFVIMLLVNCNLCNWSNGKSVAIKKKPNNNYAPFVELLRVGYTNKLKKASGLNIHLFQTKKRIKISNTEVYFKYCMDLAVT